MVAVYPLRANGLTGPVAQSIASSEAIVLPAGRMEASLSIIVPTRNEAANIGPLLTRIKEATVGRDVEVIFVDDSDDNTPEAITCEAMQSAIPVCLIARPPERRSGLGSAVVEGMRIAQKEWICVMDGDLQHPPEVIPQLLQEATANGSDLAIGSRLTRGAETDGLSLPRKFISRSLALMCRLTFPGRLGRLSDPLTGFFVVRRGAVDPERLQPDGFKILLELLIRSPELSVIEVPFAFGERNAGESKASSRELFRLGRHMLKLRIASLEHLFRFLAVGSSGIAVNSILLFLFSELFSLHYLLGAVLATQGSTLWNFVGTEQWVFNDRQQHRPRWQRAAGFFAVNNGMLLLRGPMLVAFTSWLGIHYLVANLLSLVLMTFFRFAIADRLLWHAKPATTEAVHYRYHYSIHEIVHVRSTHRLPELAYFQLPGELASAALDVHVVSHPQAFRREDSIVYEENLNHFGFSIVINRDEGHTAVYASRLIGRSPHVLYTNVVEPLLRWMLVERGYALMHGATVAFGGAAVFVTARTDTGKTTTILQTLRNNLDRGTFLSDDMTIFRRDGLALSYPKPLTISQHTLHAVGGAPLTRKERTFLQVQSRLHSRDGRRFGMMLTNMGLPGATLNAITQMLVPPPKFMVHRLIPGARYLHHARLAQLVVIERGEDGEEHLNEEQKLETVMANAEDAYGFPPYPHLAHLLSRRNGEDLHTAEREIVAEAILALPAIHLRSTQYDWYRRLPHLAEHYEESALPAGATTAPALPEQWPAPQPVLAK